MSLGALFRWLSMCLLAMLLLQLFFVLRVASMAIVNPESTSFERTQIWHILQRENPVTWRQQWVDLPQISKNLQRAVIASEDDTFSQHDGIRWEALKSAWNKNAQAQARAERQTNQRPGNPAPQVKIVGGSTITQQLAKNLFLSGERTMLRKGQEMLITFALEFFLSKSRILEIYLNSVEWGVGVFGAEAATQHYFRKTASQLSAWEGARLAVMLPRPRHFERLPSSPYLAERASVIVARMNNVALP